MEEKELTIEQSFAEIEEILNKLESNEVTLEDSFLLYQSGMQQIKHCNDLMNAVEQKVQMLNSKLWISIRKSPIRQATQTV